MSEVTRGMEFAAKIAENADYKFNPEQVAELIRMEMRRVTMIDNYQPDELAGHDYYEQESNNGNITE